MQHRKRRAVRVILDGVRFRVRELKLGMEAGDLNDAPKAKTRDQTLRLREEICIVHEPLKYARVNEQGRLDRLDGRRCQRLEFVGEARAKCFRIEGVADDVTNQIALKHPL